MATPQGDYMKSPFDHVFSFVPQGHEKALKHALYNAVALFLLMVGTCVGYAVCFILEPFIKPLLWALLCGSVLHPFKHSLATKLRAWFENLRNSSTPFVLGIAVQPVKLLNKFSDAVGSFLHKYLFPIIAVGVALPFCVLLYHYTPKLLICFVQLVGTYTFLVINWIVSCLNLKLLLSGALAHGLFLVFTPRSPSGRTSMVSCFLWLAAVCHTAAALVGGGSQAWNVAAFLLALSLLILGLGSEVYEVHTARQEQGSEASVMDTLKLVILQEKVPDLPEDKEKVPESLEDTVTEQEAPTNPPEEAQLVTPDVVDRPLHKKLAFRNPLTPHTLMSGRGSLTLLATSTPLTTLRNRTRVAESILGGSLATSEGITSDHCLIAVGWACAAMLICKHMWLLSILPLPIALYFIKTAGCYFGVWRLLGHQLHQAKRKVQAWYQEKQSALMPPPARGLLKILVKVNQAVTSTLEGSIDTAASVVVYAEGVHVVQVAAEVVNNTVVHNPELLQLLPEGIGDAVAQMLDNAYQYGREGISSMVRGMLGSQADPVKAAQLELQVLELWDRVYQAWVVFFTALFYLLSSSGALYKPVELITNFSPTNGKRFGGAFEAAINGVFKASFKMSVFYGLWTWLIHNLFQVKIVYLPSALAAMLGAVPFLGTYWACLPATLELWLAQERGFEALLLFVFHLLPMSVGVDTTIYSEIRGGGHPYLTGLSVAGGILCLGVEGAIIGPLLLCCLFVAINMSGALMRESPGNEDERVQAITLRSLR
ncbi:hypothetical protein B566_EDAN005851, partial [Ephemera danica]